MSNKNDENPQGAKVVKLGLNISVSGDPGTDYEIILDDKEQKAFQSSSIREEQLQFDVLPSETFTTDTPKHELEKTNTPEITHALSSTGAIPKYSKPLSATQSSESGKMSGSESGENSSPQETSIINKIKSTMEHFEKFSDHIKEIPRLRNRPLATSTPFSDKYNSRSESSLVYSEHRPKKFSHLYDFHSRKEYFKSSVKHSPPDLFLRPLPGEDCYRRGIYTRFFDVEPYRHYGSDISLNKTPEYKNPYGKYDIEKYEGPTESPLGILKKSDSESGDKQSTSSADSVKDIKIYQSGGILIMQNFKENMDVAEKKEISEFSAKLIENCNKLKMEVSGWPDDKPPEESRNSGKMVQFDLSSFDGPKSKLAESSSTPLKDESSGRMESSESTSDCMKNKDTSPQGTSQSQDLTSLSTQENDSFMSNPPGLSPTYASSKKLEWDSGADVGYLNLDLTKENLSTIEKIVLKGLSSDGLSEENIVYEKKSKSNPKSRSKFTLERPVVDSPAVEEIKNDSSRECSVEASVRTEQVENRSRGSSSQGGTSERKKTTGKVAPGESRKGENRTKFETETAKLETKSSSSREIPSTRIDEAKPEEKQLELSDKSVNVNTLFADLDWQTPPHYSVSSESATRLVDAYTKPAHKRSSQSPKTKVSKSKSRPSSQRLLRASKKPTHITGPLVTSYFDMGNPKKVYKKVEASPVLNEAELSREVEEIIIDQRFKIKNVSSGRETVKDEEIPVKDKTDGKTKGRPISASSSSNNTVLPKSDNGEHAEEKTKKTPERGRDEMIQTSDYDCESVGVQAFASQVSSDCDFRSFRKTPKKKTNRESVNTSSKNIQAFGLNASLPKQLEHPVGTEVIDNQNTKSTQFYGGALNSLPNYHSNLVTKPGESCGRTPNVLKTKRNSEVIRVKEENEKNILANDAPKPQPEPERDHQKLKNNENKENLITQKSSKKGQSTASGKNGDSEKKETERGSSKGKKKSSTSVDGSDDVSSLVLTSEVLKVHGDSIDRNIIQEKFFQSQLVELEKREMISRSTSMEMQLQLEGAAGKEFATTGCQYSPQSRATTSGGQEAEDGSSKGNSNRKIRKRGSLDQFRLSEYESQNAGEEGKSTNPDQNIETGDSLPSSTQTAHSWVPGMRNSQENSSGVGKARSFEYLPGHIYESSGNLREELPSETEQNLITSCSDSDTARGTISEDGGKDSEGRQTLILENSTGNSHDSEDRFKILDENLALLNSAVMRLWEKDAQVQSATQTLLANLSMKTGSGDWLPLAGVETSKTEVGDKQDETDNEKKEEVGSETVKTTKEKEFSIACQTEEKTPSPQPMKFLEERKTLEKRINEEKKCQIKWIENEIHHLNVLRELLEKQNSPVHTKKKRSPLSISSNETSKSEDNYGKNISTGICPRPVTPVYGCTISLSENVAHQTSGQTSPEQQRETGASPQYGLAVSLSGNAKNWQRVLMLPVGVQVQLKENSPESKEEICGNSSRRQTKISVNSEKNMLMQTEPNRSSVQTQCPSLRRSSNGSGRSVQVDLSSSTGICNACNKERCFCLSLSERSCTSPRSKSYERRDSSKLQYMDEECDTVNGNKTSNSTDIEFLEPDPVPQTYDKSSNKNSADLSENYAKSKSTQSTNCRCHKCPGRVCCTVNKPEVKTRRTSKLCLNSEEVGICRCSKVQIEKSSNCACHIIRIRGSKCCSPEKNPFAYKGDSFSKRTEDQSCQTEAESVVFKQLVDYPEISTVTEGPKMKNWYQMKVGYERRKPVEEKLQVDQKIPYERVHPLLEKVASETVEKRALLPAECQNSACGCGCRKKAGKEKAEVDDHPRHYFLKIEEAEIDDSGEQTEKKRSLEVVTVTVPVKRAGRSKIYGSDIRQSHDPVQESTRGRDVSPKVCKCCAESKQNRQKPRDSLLDAFSENIRARDSSPKSNACNAESKNGQKRPESHLDAFQDNVREQDFRHKNCKCCPGCKQNHRKSPESYPTQDLPWRTRAEKPESPGRPIISPECLPYEDASYSQPSKEYSKEEYRPCTQQLGSSYSERPVSAGQASSICKTCNCKSWSQPSSREISCVEYNSHKKRKSSIGKQPCDSEFLRFYQEDHGKCEEQNNKGFYNGGPSRNRSPESRQPSVLDAERKQGYDPEFYNYNKREFMTKSELMKEEEKKRKSYQPTLQEYLTTNRPNFYNSAERRRQMISERSKERIEKHNNRMDCLMKVIKECNQPPESKRIFTTMQMREQTMKRYKKLPEVTGKIADERKKEEYRTNRLMADIFAKKLQSEALKGHINLSNSVSVLYTI